MSQKKFDPFRQMEELPSRLYVLFAILTFTVHILICALTEANAALTGLILILIYLCISVVIYFLSRRKFNIFKSESDANEEQNNGILFTFKNNVKLPYAVVTESGRIITVNNALRHAAGAWGTVFNTDISSVCGIPMNEILFQTAEEEAETEEEGYDGEYEIQKEDTVKKECIVTMKERLYHVSCHAVKPSHKPYYILLFEDVTELKALTKLHYNELTAVGYIVVDNIDELAQYVKVNYENEAMMVEGILREWARQMNAFIRQHDKNRYIILMTREELEKQITDKFKILDRISEILIGQENMPITASIGIATTGENLAKREQEALLALDMALQRGGGQVVLKTVKGYDFFGGRTKSQQKRTGKQSRIIANHLCTLITASSNVIVMGHSNPDFDSIGACVGIAALCMYLNVEVKIVMDTESENFKSCTSRLKQYSAYKNMFIDGVTGLSKCGASTLVIIVDANSFEILEAPEIARDAFHTAVIDHHIKKKEFDVPPKLQYIDPTASSASELVSEILEFSLSAQGLRKEEANLLMSGIMVDTNNFTRTVGTRTFAAALYLRGAGASTEYARTFFEEAFEDYRTESMFGSEAKLLRDGQIAITAVDGGSSSNNRVAAAKAADKLLTIRGVNAAFALIRIGTTVFISARSNGSVNVQLILERIGGGGHFDVAGAALAETELPDAEALLTENIDAYYEESAARQP